MDRSLFRQLKRFGLPALSLILAPFVVNGVSGEFPKAPFSATTAIVLCLICVGQTVVYSLLRGRCTELERQVRAGGPGQLVMDLALNYSVRPTDKDNRYTLFKVFAHIDSDGNYKAEYERHGINQSNAAVNHVRVLTCADSTQEFAQLGVQALDLKSNQVLKAVPIEDNPRQKLFDIYFKEPVHPNEQFAFRWSILWPRVMRATRDYDYITLNDFERGVEKLSYTLEFERELAHSQFEEIGKTGGSVRVLKGKVQSRGSCYCYMLELQDPPGVAYKFSYLI